MARGYVAHDRGEEAFSGGFPGRKRQFDRHFHAVLRDRSHLDRLADNVAFSARKDAGKACQAAEDCSGFCLVETGAETGTCSPETPMFGCFAYVDLDGAEVTLCID